MLVGFQATCALMYDALTDAKLMTTYHQSKATVDLKPGGQFSLFDGNIKGEFVSLVPGKRIEQKWRLAEWPDDHYSIVTITLEARSPSVVALSLKQTGIPEEDKFGNRDIAQKVKDGWNKFFFIRLNKMLGYLSVDLGRNDDDD